MRKSRVLPFYNELQVFVATLLLAASANAVDPDYRRAGHSQGEIQLTVDNSGWFGDIPLDDWWVPYFDPITGDSIYGCIYPRGSGKKFGEGGVCIGAVSGGDTIVAGWLAGLFPGPAPQGAFHIETIDHSQAYASGNANSELDLVCCYADTTLMGDRTPMGVGVTQRSMSWSAGVVDDFVIIKYTVTNLGDLNLRRVFVGIYEHNDVRHVTSYPASLTGFIPGFLATEECHFYDTLNLMYGIDNDGDPESGQFTSTSLEPGLGIVLLGATGKHWQVNYNWWANLWYWGSWGPRQAGTFDDPFRNFGDELGRPEGDGNKYYVLSHREVDYDQIYAALDHTANGWLPPSAHKEIITDGHACHSLLSFGPFNLAPGQSFEFAIAVVGGDNVHRNPNAFENLFDPYNPYPFFNQLNFDELITNARWAKKVYDNPGVDTDGDGYRGEFCITDGDTNWYKGDGIPDFQAAVPPPAPHVRILTEMGKLTIRWNGYYSENAKDAFTQLKDFEGYRVYSGLDNRRSSLTLLTSYDHENYSRYVYTQKPDSSWEWVNMDKPFTLDSLRIMYDDPNFNPLYWTRYRPYEFESQHFFFTAMDHNQYDLTDSTGIHKVYPDAVYPGNDPELWHDSDLVLDYDEPLPKYYEYEYIHDNLLPSIPYYIAVTAFDFGYGHGNFPSLESNPIDVLTESYAQTSADSVEAQDLDVYVYPNPYRIDEHYADNGYENRLRDWPSYRARRIHFTNLPSVCTIHVFTLDGDRVRSMEHNFPDGGPEAMHHEWDMISRNAMPIVSGLYYWVVESETRTQMGKLVIIK